MVIENTSPDLSKFARQLSLPGMRQEQQQKLLQASILIVGSADQASMVAAMCQTAGVGKVNIVESFDAHHIEELFASQQVIVDALRNWQDKLLASDTCMRLRKPFVHAAASAFHLQIYTMIPGKSACLRCLLSHTGQEDLAGQILNAANFDAVTAILAALQTAEVVKLLSGLGVVPAEALLQFDAFRREFTSISGLSARLDCPDCQPRR